MRTAPVSSISLMLHEDHLEPLVRGTLEGDPRAWRRFWLAVDPTIERMAGRFRVGSVLSQRRDERRDIVVRVMERLRQDGFSRLRTFHGVLLRRDGSFRAWLSVMTKRTAVDHIRGHAEYLGAGATDAERRWIELLPLPEGFEKTMASPPRAEQVAEATRIQAYAEANLPAAQHKALNLWLQGHNDEEIARALGLEKAKSADLLVRTTLMHLRRRFSQP